MPIGPKPVPSQPTTTDELDDLISHPTESVIDTVRKTSGTIAVLGAGGKMGFHVSCMLQRALAAAGLRHRVVTVSRFRAPLKRKQFESAGFDVVAADLSDSQQAKQLPDADNVFFLAGVKFGTAANPQLLQRMNIEMPEIVAARYPNSRIVALSSGCVYEFVTPASGGSTELSPTNPPGAYARSCLGREQVFVDSSQRWGTTSCLIRLNYSNELRYGVLVDIALRVLSGEPVSLETGYVNVIWQGDAVAHIVQSLAYVDSPPFVLNVTGPKIVSVRALAEAFGSRFHRVPVFTGQETETAWINNASLSHQLLGPPRISVDQMIDWIAHWLDIGGPTLNKPTRFEIRDGDY